MHLGSVLGAWATRVNDKVLAHCPHLLAGSEERLCEPHPRSAGVSVCLAPLHAWSVYGLSEGCSWGWAASCRNGPLCHQLAVHTCMSPSASLALFSSLVGDGWTSNQLADLPYLGLKFPGWAAAHILGRGQQEPCCDRGCPGENGRGVGPRTCQLPRLLLGRRGEVSSTGSPTSTDSLASSLPTTLYRRALPVLLVQVLQPESPGPFSTPRMAPLVPAGRPGQLPRQTCTKLSECYQLAGPVGGKGALLP